MIKKTFILLAIIVSLFLNTGNTLAAPKVSGEDCNKIADTCPLDQSCYLNKATEKDKCQDIAKASGEDCIQNVNTCPNDQSCYLNKATEKDKCQDSSGAPSGIGKIFGSINAPDAISKFAGGDATGAAGIGKFLSNLIELIFAFAGIAIIFMLLWGAFDWITSEGDKEKLKSAQNKIINAIIGIILFGVAFAILRVLGVFTGFTFFFGQNFTVKRDSQGNINEVQCANGKAKIIYGGTYTNADVEAFCK